MKTCTRCGLEKSRSEFRSRKASKDGLESACKSCRRSHDNNYYRITPGRKESIRKSDNARLDKNREYILEYFKSHPCIDCGETDIRVLEFDHRSDKLKNISVMIRSHNVEALEKEIAKCDVRCANHHRIKTIDTLGWWRSAR